LQLLNPALHDDALKPPPTACTRLALLVGQNCLLAAMNCHSETAILVAERGRHKGAGTPNLSLLADLRPPWRVVRGMRRDQ